MAGALFLCACSNKPGDGEIKSHVLAVLPQGKVEDTIVTIENFAKTNGLKKDDNTYIASIHYEMVVSPVKGNDKPQRFPKDEQVTLVKTEKGWRLYGQ
jgi:hypothetical protein